MAGVRYGPRRRAHIKAAASALADAGAHVVLAARTATEIAEARNTIPGAGATGGQKLHA